MKIRNSVSVSVSSGLWLLLWIGIGTWTDKVLLLHTIAEIAVWYCNSDLIGQ